MNANLTIMLAAMIAGAWAFLQLIAKARQEALEQKAGMEPQSAISGNDKTTIQKVPEVFGDR